MSVALLRAPLAAVAFLTRVPVGRLAALDAGDVRRGAPFFPLVGGAAGALCGLVADALAGPLPPLAAGALAVGLGALLTGAFHLDALADTADALGGTTRERALEIMRDHAVGAFGASALVVVLVLDAAVLGALGAQGDAALAGLAAGALGRAAILPLAALPPARPGLEGHVLAGTPARAALPAALLAALLAAPIGVPGLAAAAAGAGVTIALALLYRAWLGGVTGDQLGAGAKLAETAALVAALAAL